MRDLSQYPFEIRPLSDEEGGGFLISFIDFSESQEYSCSPRSAGEAGRSKHELAGNVNLGRKPMIFLHGGGDNPDNRVDTFGRFVQAATINSSCNLALVITEDTDSQARESFNEYKEIFASLPNAPTQIHPIFVAATQVWPYCTVPVVP